MKKLISQAYTLLNEHGFDWSICGGTAIDLYLADRLEFIKT